MQKIIVFLSLILFYIAGVQAKIINPVSSDGVKVIDLNEGAFSKQIDKREKELITTLKFVGFKSLYSFNEKDRALIKELPNLNTIEYSSELKISDFWPNIKFGWFETLPNITKLVLSEYSSGNELYYPNTLLFLASNIHKKLSEKLIKDEVFPNLKTFVYKIGTNNTPGIFPEESYALMLNPRYYEEANYVGKWGAHIYPSKGEVILERGKAPNFNTEPTIIPAYTELNNPSKKYIFTDNIMYIGDNAFVFEYTDSHKYDMTINDGNSWLILYKFVSKRNPSNQEINRPLVILDDFYLEGPNRTVTFKKPVSIQGNGKISNYDGVDIIFEDEVATTFSALEDAKKIKFNKVPTIFDNSPIDWSNIVVEIPDDSNIDDFVALGIPKSSINTISTEPLSIHVPEPNKILSYLSPDKLKEVEILKISGHLYDTDIKILSGCSNLKKLDLSNAIITESPQTQKERQEDAEFASVFFGMLKDYGNDQYKKGKTSEKAIFEANLFSKMADADLKKIVESDIKCYIPYNAFSNLKYLKSIILPQTATVIESCAFSNCPSLEDVEFPPYLKSIGTGAFYATGLKEVVLPASVKSIGSYFGDNDGVKCTFGKSKNLKLLDLGNCSFSAERGKVVVWECPLYNNGSMTLVLPQNIERIIKLELSSGSVLYCPKTLKMFGVEERNVDFSNITIYVQTENPAQGSLYDCTIHVPDGALTAWYAKYHERNKIVEGTSSKP
ncbi:MAG: leucine-rich repeat protein [Barnesiella sp.]|nr:leucine-rich repeat protein [Barnesiella sp.]